MNTSVITNQISEYVKNSIDTNPGCMATLEEEFKQEIWKNHQLDIQKKRGEEELPLDPINIKTIPSDLLINEKVNAKLFQFKLKRLGIALSLWEVFTLFEHLNTKYARMHFEPQRYHHIMFANFYQYIKSEEYTRVTAAKPQSFGAPSDQKSEKPSERKSSAAKPRSRSREAKSRANYESGPAKTGNQVYDIQEHGYNNEPSGIEHDQENGSSDKNNYWHKNEDSDTEDPRRPYKQLKHVFEIKVKELKNIPILNKFICQSNLTGQNDQKLSKMAKSQANKYI